MDKKIDHEEEKKYYKDNKGTYFIQRYMELQEKMQSCYEEYREARHLQVSVITACGALLGIITGTSIYSCEIGKVKFNIPNWLRQADSNAILISIVDSITIRRIIFWMVSLIFCVTFLYVAKIGIENVLRYFYIRNLSVRAHEYKMDELPDVDRRGRLLTFSEYSSPILTSSPAHVGSIHTLLHFVCNYGAIGLSILFCLILILLHFLMIEARNISDRLIFATICLIIVGTLILYIYLSYHAEEVVQYAWDESHANHNRWKKEYDEKSDVVKGKRFYYRTARQFRRILSYYIYPRKNTIPYSFLMIMGFFFGVFLFNTEIRLGNLFLIWWLFDFSFYQSRYLLNDIRGLKEDVEEYKALFPDDDIDKQYKHVRVKRKLGSIIVEEIRLRNKIKHEANPNIEITEDDKNREEVAVYKRFIGYSKLAIVLRIVFALFILFVTGIYKNKMPLVVTMGIALIFITIIYEAIKESEKISRCFMVGIVAIGFPLRFCTGLFSAQRDWTFENISKYNIRIIVFAALILYVFGLYVIYMLWYRQMIRRYLEMKGSGDHPGNLEKCDLRREKYNYVKRYMAGADLENTSKFKNADLWYLTGNEKILKGRRPWNILYSIATMGLTTFLLLIYATGMGIELNCQVCDIIVFASIFLINMLMAIIASKKTQTRSHGPLVFYLVLAVCNGIITFFLYLLNYKSPLFFILCIMHLANNFVYWAMRTVSLYFVREFKERFIGLIHFADMHMFGNLAHSYTCKRGL